MTPQEHKDLTEAILIAACNAKDENGLCRPFTIPVAIASYMAHALSPALGLMGCTRPAAKMNTPTPQDYPYAITHDLVRVEKQLAELRTLLTQLVDAQRMSSDTANLRRHEPVRYEAAPYHHHPDYKPPKAS